MRLVPTLAGVLAFSVSCALAMASEPAKKPARKAKSHAETPALDKRVAESKTILVGEGMRIYFVDRQYRETPYIRAAGEGADRSAMIVVKVVKVLHPPGASVPEKILVPIETSRNVLGEGRSPYDEQVARHVGKQHIWFGEFVTQRDYGDPRALRPLENPVTLFRAGSWSAKKGPTANPLPAKQLAEVEEAIARVRGGAKPAAPPPEKAGG